jgi:UDP-arabinose 4-epimerase
MTKVLVTGGAGYIGSHTCKALHGCGWPTVVYDSLATGAPSAVRWGDLVEGDLGDPSALAAALRRPGVNTVLHFAASAYVGESMRDPGKYFRNNVTNTVNLLEAMVEAGVTRIVFSSSCATYGVPDRLPVREDTPQRPVSTYGESKLMCERIIRWFGKVHGIQWVILRYFNAAGADPDGEIGECHDPEPHLIPIVLQAAAAGLPVAVYGTDYPTPDGTAIRDYVHVTDLARAHVQAMKHLRNGGDSVALNLGTGVGTSVRDVIKSAERVTGRSIAVDARRRRPGDPPALWAAPGLAGELLGWAPQYPCIDDAVRHAWEWFAKHPAVPRAGGNLPVGWQ